MTNKDRTLALLDVVRTQLILSGEFHYVKRHWLAVRLVVSGSERAHYKSGLARAITLYRLLERETFRASEHRWLIRFLMYACRELDYGRDYGRAELEKWIIELAHWTIENDKFDRTSRSAELLLATLLK